MQALPWHQVEKAVAYSIQVWTLWEQHMADGTVQHPEKKILQMKIVFSVG